MNAPLLWLNITLVVSCLAIPLAICPLYSEPKLKTAESVKSDMENLCIDDLLAQKLNQNLSCVESEMHSSIVKLQAQLKLVAEEMLKLEITVSEHCSDKMKEKENIKEIIAMRKYLRKSDEKLHILHRQNQEECHCLKDKGINKLNSIAKFKEEKRQLHKCGRFKEKSTKDEHDAKVRSHLSQENTDVCLVDMKFQPMDNGNDSLEKCENTILNKTKQDRKGSSHIYENLMVQEHFGDILEAVETKLLIEFGEEKEMMHRKVKEEVKIRKDEVLTALDSGKDLLDNKKHADIINWKEDQRKQSEDMANQNAKMLVQILELNTTLTDLSKSSKRHTKFAKNITEKITKVSDDLLALHKGMEHIEKNMFDKSALLIVIVLDNAILLFLAISVCTFRGRNRNVNNIVEIRQDQAMCRAGSSPISYSPAKRVLSQVQSRQHLERRLCVISFYEETHPLHMRMTRSVIHKLDLQPMEFIIRNHETILKIPLVFLYFLYVDFNERNVILEDPDAGLGDLRLTTVQAIQKMGGKLVILYVRDPKSKKLDHGKLYNSDLLSVTSQRELSSLDRMSRFVSAHDSLSEYQKMHLRKIVSDDLHKQL